MCTLIRSKTRSLANTQNNFNHILICNDAIMNKTKEGAKEEEGEVNTKLALVGGKTQREVDKVV